MKRLQPYGSGYGKHRPGLYGESDITLTLAEQFKESIRAAGLTPPDVIVTDGKLHRFSSNGKRGDDAGWYVFHPDGIPAGCFGDWRNGFSRTWRGDIGGALTSKEEHEHRRKVDAALRKRAAKDIWRKKKAREQANLIWATGTPCAKHPYLTTKHIQANGARLYKGLLVLPMRADGLLHSLQFINVHGEKKFLTGGRISECYFSIGNPLRSVALCVAEGFATAATIYEATGFPVVAAFSAANLRGVAKALREKFPQLPLILCADDDYMSAGNPGLTKAMEAARAVDGLVAVPTFGSRRPEGATDFNDMAFLYGKEHVRRLILGVAHSVPDRCPVEQGETEEADIPETQSFQEIRCITCIRCAGHE